MEIVRWLALAGLILFSLYTVNALRTENFWRSLRTMMNMRWGRQVVADLYVGLFLFSFLIYLNEGSLLVMALWLVPTLALGNLVPLVYFVVNFQSIVSHFG